MNYDRHDRSFMRRCSHLVGYLAALALLGLTGPAASDSLTAEQRLAGRMLRSAQQVMASENLNPSGVELARKVGERSQER